MDPEIEFVSGPVAQSHAEFERYPVAALVHHGPWQRVDEVRHFPVVELEVAGLDGQGRLALSESVREYAALDKDVVIVGVADRIEIWATEVWASIQEEADDFYADIEETLATDGSI